jgi:signal transduction histidine kinase
LRPLDRAGSIKFKLGVTIVGSVLLTTVAVYLGLQAGLGWLSALVALGVALVSIQLIARGMTSPLREMASAANSMARGDYSRRVTATSRDEVGQLARTFNQMASDLAEVDAFRKELIANVSHELRTPITALQAVLENIVDGVEEPDDTRLKVMLAQVQRLGSLVNQLLDLSKLEAGAVPLDRRDFEVKAFIEGVVAESALHQHASERKVEIDIAAPAGVMGHGDPERLHQVLANLVENAIRHSPDGGRVKVAATHNQGRLTFHVDDEGPGIPAEVGSRIFERYYRTEDGGTGLGLAIARWIVDLHGGEIRAESGPTVGCRMVVALPKEAA